MAEGTTPPEGQIEALRERLTELLAEWGTEMSTVLGELEQSRTRLSSAEAQLGSVEDDAAERNREIASLGERVRRQDELITALRDDAQLASELRRDVSTRELEIERLKSELESKQELVHALRREAESSERLKNEAKNAQQELDAVRGENKRLEAEVRRLEESVASLQEAAEAEAAEESAEIESLRAELDARRTLIKSLRVDAERAQQLEDRLEEKRDVIRQLEATINRHANTIVESKRNAEVWKKKYRALKGVESTTVTNEELSGLAAADISAIARAAGGADADGEKTIAIDMRRSLIEARRAAQTPQQK